MKAGFGYSIGRRHAAEPDEALRVCQDLAASYSDDDVTIIAVADGKAGRNAPQAAVAAAQLNIDTLIEFFRDPATWRIAEKEDFKNTALRMLDSALENVAGGGEFSYEELRATVSAVAVRANGEFLALSIGDGTVVALDEEMNPSVLIPPYREGIRNRTVYTNDPDGASAHMSAWGGTLDQSNFLAFAVFTDGADYLTKRMVEGANILRQAAACTLFDSGDKYIHEVVGEIAEEHSRDDVALAVLTSDSDQAYIAAKNILLEAKAAKAETSPAEEATQILEEPVETVTEAEDAFDEALSDYAEATAFADEAPAADKAEDALDEFLEAEEEALEELPNPPMPGSVITPPPVSADPTPAEVVVLRAVHAEPLSAQELVNGGYVRHGRILESVLPLLRANRIRYEDGKFRGNE